MNRIFGLCGFWNRGRREQIIKLIKERLPKDYLIEEIGFWVAEKMFSNRELYSMYVVIAHKTKGYSVDYSYWKFRDSGYYWFDLEENKTNFGK